MPRTKDYRLQYGHHAGKVRSSGMRAGLAGVAVTSTGLGPNRQQVSCLVAASHADQEDRLSAIAVLLRITRFLHLCLLRIQRDDSITLTFRQCELQHKHLPARQHNHVRSPME